MGFKANLGLQSWICKTALFLIQFITQNNCHSIEAFHESLSIYINRNL